jgi:hypothetical protein
MDHAPRSYSFQHLNSLCIDMTSTTSTSSWPGLRSLLSPKFLPALRKLQIRKNRVFNDPDLGGRTDNNGGGTPWKPLLPQLTNLFLPTTSLRNLAPQLALTTSLQSLVLTASARAYTAGEDPTAKLIEGLRQQPNLSTFRYHERHSSGQSDDYWYAVMERFEKIKEIISDSDKLKLLSLHIEDAGGSPGWIELKKEIRIICEKKPIKLIKFKSSRQGCGDDLTEDDGDMVPIVSFTDLASQLAGSTSLESIDVAAEAREYTELDDPTAMFIDGLRNNVNLHTLRYYERHNHGESNEYWTAVIKRFKRIRDFIRDSDHLKILALHIEDAGRRPIWIRLKKKIRIICERKGIEIVECRTFYRGSGNDLTDDSDNGSP